MFACLFCFVLLHTYYYYNIITLATEHKRVLLVQPWILYMSQHMLARQPFLEHLYIPRDVKEVALRMFKAFPVDDNHIKVFNHSAKLLCLFQEGGG